MAGTLTSKSAEVNNRKRVPSRPRREQGVGEQREVAHGGDQGPGGRVLAVGLS